MKKGQQVWISMALVASMFATGISCKKDSGNAPEEPQAVQPLPTPVGTSKGAAVTKQIGAAGGNITSADQQITINIPAGALSSNTTIGVEPITNTNVAGIGTAFRLTPHGQHFDKPVTITYSWADHADSIGLMQTLGLAYQMDNNIWKFVGAESFDQEAQTVTFKTTHFSDWSLMNQVSLAPYRADLDPGQSQTVTAVLFTSVEEDGLFVPLPPLTAPGDYDEPGYPVGNPQPLPSKYMKKWHLAGPGKITNVTQYAVNYQAPSSVNSYTTAAVSLELKAPAGYTGQYMLVSNINIKGGSFVELSVGGGTPVTFPATPVVKMGDRYMLANPEDEGGGYFLLTWTGGVGSHPFDLSNTGTYMHFLTPGANYTSRFRVHEESDISPSGGSVNVTRLGNGWAEGTFNATEAGYTETLIPRTTLVGKFRVALAH